MSKLDLCRWLLPTLILALVACAETPEPRCAARSGEASMEADSERAAALGESLYRLCEAQKNGVIGKEKFEELYVYTLETLFVERREPDRLPNRAQRVKLATAQVSSPADAGVSADAGVADGR